MSILSGYGKYKRYILTNEGYKLCSQWTSSNTVEMGDGNTAETNLGSIKGITDSLTATSSNIALSASAGNNLQTQVDTLNSNFTWKKADNFATAFNNAKSEVLITVYFVISNIRHAVELIIPKYNVQDARYITGAPYSTSSLVYVQFEKVGTNLTIQVFLNSVNLAFTTDILYR